MYPVFEPANWALKTPGEGESGDPADKSDPDGLPVKAPELERVLICARCGFLIAKTSDLLKIGGETHHSFVNPHSLVFQIICVSSAEGCVSSGETSRHWTWFPGYSWQVQHCKSCSEHVGWLFRGTDHRFWGLIADKLLEVDQPLGM